MGFPVSLNKLDAYSFIGIFFLLFIGIPIGVGLLIYFVPQKLGFPKTGKYLTILFALFVVTVFLMNVFEDRLFTKNDARKLVEEQEIQLTEKFELLENESVWVPGNSYHTFTLRISENDKFSAIEKITNSPGYKIYGEPADEFITKGIMKQNYETEEGYVREFPRLNGKGIVPSFRRITIDKKENKLVFEEVAE
jgi:hypothetical protein